MKSYLTDRYQLVNVVNNIYQKLNKLVIKQSVPQGSMLGPLLFLVYDYGKSFQLADVPSVIAVGLNISNVALASTQIADKMKEWAC